MEGCLLFSFLLFCLFFSQFVFCWGVVLLSKFGCFFCGLEIRLLESLKYQMSNVKELKLQNTEENIFFSKKPSRNFFLPTPLIPIILCSITQYFYNINHNTLLKSVVHNKFTFHKVFLRSKKTATVVTFRTCHGCDILIVIWSLRRSGLS